MGRVLADVRLVGGVVLEMLRVCCALVWRWVVYHVLHRRSAHAALAASWAEQTAALCAAVGGGARSCWLQAADGVRLHVVLAGSSEASAPLVLLLHGFPENWFSCWRHVIGPLAAAGYRVAAPDLRGYAASGKPLAADAYQLGALVRDVAALVGQLGGGRAVLLAHDFGGALAWQVAMQRPQLVRGLLLCNAPHPAAFQAALQADWRQALRSWYMALFIAPRLPEALLTLDPWAAAADLASQAAPGTYDEAARAYLCASWLQPGAATAMHHWYRANAATPPPAGPVRAPVLLLWGGADWQLSPQVADVGRWVPQARLVRLPGVSHWLPAEAPRQLLQHALPWLAALPPA